MLDIASIWSTLRTLRSDLDCTQFPRIRCSLKTIRPNHRHCARYRLLSQPRGCCAHCLHKSAFPHWFPCFLKTLARSRRPSSPPVRSKNISHPHNLSPRFLNCTVPPHAGNTANNIPPRFALPCPDHHLDHPRLARPPAHSTLDVQAFYSQVPRTELPGLSTRVSQ